MKKTFYRELLTSQQAKAHYDAILAAIQRGELTGIFPLPLLDRETASDDALTAYRALWRDRPDFFFLNRRSTVRQQGDKLTLEVKLLYSPAQIPKIRASLEERLRYLTIGLDRLSLWEREKKVYERLRRSLNYVDHGREYDHNIVGPVLRGEGVCEGFSCLLVLALRRAGIPCIRLSGLGEGERHCWSVAWLDGQPYHLDITWESMDGNGNLTFFYFNLTDEQIGRDHEITTEGIPKCTDPSMEYHTRSGTLFAAPQQAGEYLSRAFHRRKGAYTVRLTGGDDITECMKAAIKRLPPMTYHYYTKPKQRAALIWAD